MSFGSNLTALREEKGMIQKDLAAYLNTSVGTISNYERDRHFPDQNCLCKLADLFGVSVDYMLGRTKYRYDLQTLQKPFTKEYSISDFINTSLELTPQNKYLLTEYVKLLRIKERTSSGT